MALIWGAPRVEQSIAGDVVSTRRVIFRDQKEQIRYLRQMVNESRCLYAIRARARDVVFRQYSCHPRDQVAHALAIGTWVQKNITYVEELPEVFQTPSATIAQGYGDCDDVVGVVCSLLEAVGIFSEVVGMEWTETDPLTGIRDRSFHHIFGRALLPSSRGSVRIPLDTTLSSPISEQRDPIQIAICQGKDLRIYVR